MFTTLDELDVVHHAIFRIHNRIIFCRCGWEGKVADVADMWNLYTRHLDAS